MMMEGKSMRHLVKYFFLFCLGGGLYYGIECLFRGFSHPSMYVLGGLCFVICGGFNEFLPARVTLPAQMFLCALVITTLELVFGYILNIRMGLHIWDYSGHFMNFRGQICLLFSVIWFFLGGLAVVVDDYVRYWFFGEEKPSYIFFGKQAQKIKK